VPPGSAGLDCAPAWHAESGRGLHRITNTPRRLEPRMQDAFSPSPLVGWTHPARRLTEDIATPRFLSTFLQHQILPLPHIPLRWQELLLRLQREHGLGWGADVHVGCGQPFENLRVNRPFEGLRV
jgi:hypothetical protein